MAASLNSGNNTVRLTATGTSGGNLDHLKVLGGPAATPTSTPTATATATPTPTPTVTPTPGVTMVVNDNFNNDTVGVAPSGWTTALNGSGTVTVEAVPSSSDKSVKVYKNVSANDTKAIKTFSAQSGIVTVELKVRAESTTAYYCLPYINASDGTRAISVAFDGGNIKSYIGGTVTTIQAFTAGTWYDLKIVINTDTDTYDLYINGVQQKSGVGLRNPVTNISVMECYIGTNNTGTLYFDNVKVYK